MPYKLWKFRQASLLTGETDPLLKAGVCASACDFWLEYLAHDLGTGPYPRMGRPPAERLRELADNWPHVCARQKNYVALIRLFGDKTAARSANAVGGFDVPYSEQTHVMKTPAPGYTRTVRDVAGELARDLKLPAQGASWTLKLVGGGGHAVAGFHGWHSEAQNFHRSKMFVFDPNVGEWSPGELGEELSMLEKALAPYAITAVKRLTL